MDKQTDKQMDHDMENAIYTGVWSVWLGLILPMVRRDNANYHFL